MGIKEADYAKFAQRELDILRQQDFPSLGRLNDGAGFSPTGIDQLIMDVLFLVAGEKVPEAIVLGQPFSIGRIADSGTKNGEDAFWIDAECFTDQPDCLGDDDAGVGAPGVDYAPKQSVDDKDRCAVSWQEDWKDSRFIGEHGVTSDTVFQSKASSSAVAGGDEDDMLFHLRPHVDEVV